MKRLLPLLFLSIILLPITQAQVSGHGNTSQDCMEVPTLAGGLNTVVQPTEACITAPYQVASDTGTFTATVAVTGPTRTTPTLTMTWTAVSGCTLNGAAVARTAAAAAVDLSSSQRFTMTSGSCELTARAVYASSLGTEIDHLFPLIVTSINAFTRTETHHCSAVLTQCNGARLNISNIDNIVAWPTLNVAQSGTWTITDDANGWATHQDPLSGTVNIVNSGSQAITLSGGITAGITGSLNIDSLTRLCDSSPHAAPCNTPRINSSTIVAISNSSFSQQSSLNVTSSFDNFIPLVFWFIAFVLCLRNAKLLGAGISCLGILTWAIPQMPLPWRLAVVPIFVIALWLEAIARERIYKRFLTTT